MIDAVIVLKGPELNATLASVEYGHWGQKTNQPIIICNSWQEGFEQAKNDKCKLVLFVRSGTIFLDWDNWISLLRNYPHQGLVAHLIWHPTQLPYIDDQCWLVDLSKFDLSDLNNTEIKSRNPIRSDQNLHDNYTPLWIKTGDQTITYTSTHFGQGLIAKQLNNNKVISNWTPQARDLKFFCYPNIDVQDKIYKTFSDYLTLAENQLWVFNNEQFSITNKTKLVTPGSGLHWMFNIIQSHVTQVDIVDISKIQIAFCNKLWTQWDGVNYGEFSWNFIQDQKLTHYEIDQANLSDLDRLMLKKPSRFIEYTNCKFDQSLLNHGIEDFADKWQQAKQYKKLTIFNDNLVHWILAHPTEKNNLWISNILDYKWTKLNTSSADCEKFKQLI